MYSKTNWVDDSTPAINATNLNKIENGIKASHDGTHIYAASSNGTDSYAITFTNPFTSYNTGMVINFKADVSSAGSATLNVDGLGAKTIKKINLDGKVILSDNDIFQNGIYTLVYDGTDFILINPLHTIFGKSGYEYLSVNVNGLSDYTWTISTGFKGTKGSAAISGNNAAGYMIHFSTDINFASGMGRNMDGTTSFYLYRNSSKVTAQIFNTYIYLKSVKILASGDLELVFTNTNASTISLATYINWLIDL